MLGSHHFGLPPEFSWSIQVKVRFSYIFGVIERLKGDPHHHTVFHGWATAVPGIDGGIDLYGHEFDSAMLISDEVDPRHHTFNSDSG